MNFILIGAAGYIAPKHFQAIKEVGGTLLAAFDPHDSVGVIDKYFPNAHFFTEFERFDRHVEKLKRGGTSIDYVSICSPNYLHDAHIRYALRIGANAICEKPMVLNPWNLDALAELENDNGCRVFNVLQLRYHEGLQKLKADIDSKDKRYTVALKYVTPRGEWYQSSWKGRIEKSGGILTNIGIHLFDTLMWLFGEVQDYSLDNRDPDYARGKLRMGKADVTWELSLRKSDLPDNSVASWRTLQITGKDLFEFSPGFTNLHTAVYKDAVAGRGYGIKEVRPSVSLVHAMRDVLVPRPMTIT